MNLRLVIVGLSTGARICGARMTEEWTGIRSRISLLAAYPVAPETISSDGRTHLVALNGGTGSRDNQLCNFERWKT